MIFTLRMTGDNEADLKVAVALAMRHAPGPVVTHCHITKTALKLNWRDFALSTKLPMEFNEEMVLATVKDFLKKADYGEAPDTDGDAVKGFDVRSDDWAMTIDVRPNWIIYGK